MTLIEQIYKYSIQIKVLENQIGGLLKIGEKITNEEEYVIKFNLKKLSECVIKSDATASIIYSFDSLFNYAPTKPNKVEEENFKIDKFTTLLVLQVLCDSFTKQKKEIENKLLNILPVKEMV